MNDSQSTNRELPKWLEELQQKSWEPEILLSGIVLYGLFNLPPALDQALLYFKTNIFGQSNDVDNLVNVLKVATYWMIGGLILHLISRGIWVGMVGLSYTFPKGIKYESLNYDGRFEKKIKKIPTFQSIIINLEKICSSLFSISFMMFMVMIGAYLYLFVLLLVPFFSILFITNSFDNVAMDFLEYYAVIVLVIGALGMVDFITLGYLRRFRWFAKVYWPLHWLISKVTFSRHYRGIYYGLVSNVSKWYIFLFLVLFTVISIFSLGEVGETYSGTFFSRITLWHNTRGNSIFSGYYDDQNSDLYSIKASIPSDIIDKNTLRLFVVADISLEDSIRAYGAKPERKQRIDSLTRDAKSSALINSFYHIYLDDSLLKDLPLKFHYKTHTKQKGYLAYIDVTNLSSGLHEVKIGGPPSMYKKRSWAIIPFYREVRSNQDYTPSSQPIQEEIERPKSIKPFIIK
jgi:hypothetical protein